MLKFVGLQFAIKVAILWEGDDPKDVRHVTYKELHRDVCKLANALKAYGVRKGDNVAIYMPMVPEAAVAMVRIIQLRYPIKVSFVCFYFSFCFRFVVSYFCFTSYIRTT